MTGGNDTERRIFSELACMELRKTVSSYMTVIQTMSELLPQCYSVLSARKHVKEHGIDQADQEQEERQVIHTVLEHLQKVLISLGEKLEEDYHLQDTPLLRHLERCCENAYCLLDGTAEDMNAFLRELEEIPDMIDRSVEVRRRRLTVAAILKNEGPYIREWVEYHRMAGVDYFCLFDNMSTDGMWDLLQPYVEEGIMSVTRWPGRVVMFDTYNEALKRHRFDTDYLVYIDGDEFIVPLMEGRNIPDCVDFLMERFNQRKYGKGIESAGIGVNWRMYGTSGHVKKPEGLVIENYLYRAKEPCRFSVHIKTICNPRCVRDISNPHYPNCRSGYAIFSQRGSYIPEGTFYDSHFDALQVNHYFTKSEEEFIARKKLGRVNISVESWSKDEVEEALGEAREANEVYDPVLLPYVEKIKERLSRLP